MRGVTTVRSAPGPDGGGRVVPDYITDRLRVMEFMIRPSGVRVVVLASADKANELMMTGELITAEEALALHIVNKVVPDAEFDPEVRRVAGRIASRSPLLMRLGKQALNASRDLALPDALNYLRGSWRSHSPPRTSGRG
jgi:enoyl-CoA hydratase/carnithine racemase